LVCYLIYLYFKHLKSNKYKTKGLASVRLIIKVSIYEIKNASAYEKPGHNFYHLIFFTSLARSESFLILSSDSINWSTSFLPSSLSM